jgi:ribosomal protein S18 acetylase RimI-like enzyme
VKAALLDAAVRIAPTRWKFSDRAILLRKALTARDGVDLPMGCQWVWAGPEELRVMDQHPEATSRSAYDRRAKRGDACLCVKNGDELVGYRWIARKAACLYCGFSRNYELMLFPLQPRQAFLYDLYVYSSYRKHGYGTLLMDLALDVLQNEGVGEVFSLVDPDNHPMLRLNARLGFEAVRMVFAFRIRQWSAVAYGANDDPALQRWTKQFGPSTGSTPHA